MDHRIRAMEKLANKFGLYIADTTKQLDRAKLQGKFNNLIESKVILRASSLLDILAETKIVSLCTQKANTNITDITDAAQSTQCHYNRLKKKLDEEPEFVFKLPTLTSVLSEIKENHCNKTYLDQKLNNFTQAKDYIQNHASYIESKIITCFDNYFANIYLQANELHSCKRSDNF